MGDPIHIKHQPSSSLLRVIAAVLLIAVAVVCILATGEARAPRTDPIGFTVAE